MMALEVAFTITSTIQTERIRCIWFLQRQKGAKGETATRAGFTGSELPLVIRPKVSAFLGEYVANLQKSYFPHWSKPQRERSETKSTTNTSND